MMQPKILFITGSINQTTQMHQIANHLPEFDCWFSQIFVDFAPFQWLIDNTELLTKTVISGQFKENAEKYCRDRGLKIDYKARLNHYDLVVYCSDMIIPKRMLQTKTVWIQEGMIDKYTVLSKIVNSLRLPSYLAIDTSLNGSSNLCDVYCAASKGYKERFSDLGTDKHKIIATGIPNFDNCKQFLDNDFPLNDYVLVATSDARECFRNENRPAFIRNCVKIAAGRQLIFKLHPNEIFERAIAEIKENAPVETIIYTTGNINPMIANCEELITQYSSAVYVGMALGKKVHSFFEMDELKKQVPIQNEGKSSQYIAQICRDFIAFKGEKQDFMKNYKFEKIDAELVYAEEYGLNKI